MTRQCAKTMILNAQVGFRMTFAILLMCLKNTITSLFVLLTGCYSINNYDRVLVYSQTEFALTSLPKLCKLMALDS